MRGTSVTACGRLLVALVIALGFSSLSAQAGTKFKLVPAEDEDNFGERVALDGDTVVVSVAGIGTKDKPPAGAVYVFVKSQASGCNRPSSPAIRMSRTLGFPSRSAAIT